MSRTSKHAKRPKDARHSVKTTGIKRRALRTASAARHASASSARRARRHLATRASATRRRARSAALHLSPAIRSKLEALIPDRKSRRTYLAVFSCLALLVTTCVFVGLHRLALSMTHDDAVLACPVSTPVAHTHNDDCYDEEGYLVCPLAEREMHTHDESCYDEEGKLTCGRDEVVQEHLHDDDCFVEAERNPETGELEANVPPLVKADDADAIHLSAKLVEHDERKDEGHDEHKGDEDEGHVLAEVHADAPADALPEGSKLTVSRLSEEATDELAHAATEAVEKKSDGKVCDLLGLDIAFTDKDGHKVEPSGPLSVRVSSELIGEDGDPYVVHIDKEGDASLVKPLTAEELEQRDMEDKPDELAFDTADFNPYVLAVATTDQTLTADGGESYDSVSVSAPAAAGVPRGAQLHVSEIGEGDEGYDGYLEQLDETFADEGELGQVRLYDISIARDGAEIQPQAEVGVSINLAADVADGLSDDLRVVHFGADGPELVDAVRDGQTVSFTATGFSAYAIVDAPEPYTPVSDGAADLAELADAAANGDPLYLWLRLNGDQSYCSKSINSNNCFTEVDVSRAAEWYFEPTGTANEYRIYTLDGTTRRYMRNTSGNLVGLGTQANASTFEISEVGDGLFYIKLKGQNKWLQHSNGGGGIRFWTDANDAKNPKFALMYADSYQIPDDPYGLDGKTYGLMNWDGNAKGKALMANSVSDSALEALPMTVMSKSTDNGDKLFVPNDSGATMWTFSSIDGDRYHLTTTVDGTTYYLRISDSGTSVTTTPDDQCKITVVPGTGIHTGEIYLRSESATLTYSGKAATGFNVGGTVGSEYLYLVELSELTSDYFMTHSATKVSVSDPAVTTDAQLIVYTRIWNDTAKHYEFYAIDHDGSLLRCYESGDQIQWVGGQLTTPLWSFTEYFEGEDPNYYYELYSQYGEKYLAPQLSDDTIFANDTVGINLNGRRDGKYYTTILAWDEDSYSYSGLKVDTVNKRVVPCPKSEADDFYFATVRVAPADDEPTPVSTLDNNEHGITMKLKDFKTNKTNGYNPEMSTFLGSHAGGAGTMLQQGLLSTRLGDDGYPTTMLSTAQGHSLKDFYEGEATVNHLFIASEYGNSGYYAYDSSQNFASLKPNGDFTVYRELGTSDIRVTDTMKHGQFFPYNDLQAGVFATTNGQNLFSATGEGLSESDPRKYERLYNIPTPNYYFAMELEATFEQTPSGLDAWGNDIIYEFTGDDDFWLYVDGELVIDLGGIHSAVPGKVNFRTGDVFVNGQSTTLRAVFESNFRSRNPNATDSDVADFLAEYFDEGETVFKDNTAHTMRIFYMERGAGASNLNMRFNLSSVKPNTVQLNKKLSGVDSTESVDAAYPYQIWFKTEDDPSTEVLGDGVLDVYYKDSTHEVPFRRQLTVGDTTYDNVFLLRPDEIAEITFPEGTTEYRIVECGVNTQVYDEVKANGTTLTGQTPAGAPSGSAYQTFDTGYAALKQRVTVSYDNHVAPAALRTLTFTKKLFREDGTTPITADEDSTPFKFRLSFGSEFDDNLSLANMRTYHVKDPNGNYCMWDTSQHTFVVYGSGVSDYDQIPDEDKGQVSFASSMYGAVDNIPVGYTVEVREILAGTKYQVQERDYEAPDGYSLQRYELYPNGTGEGASCTPSNDPIEGAIVIDEDPHVDIRNIKGFGLRVNKVWPDKDYIDSRDDTFFAVFNEDGGTRTLIDGTVRQLPTSESTLYWYFETLPAGISGFDKMQIYEVTLTNAQFDGDGHLTGFDGCTPIDHGQPVALNGVLKGESQSSQITYTVCYERGGLSAGSNVRVDTVTNDRPGIEIRKEDWEDHALEGASFTLDDADGVRIGSYSSDAQGLVTVAYLREGEVYTLEEASTPLGFCGLGEPMTICQNADGTVDVGNVLTERYELQQASAGDHAILTIKNRPYTLTINKVDADTGDGLAGVHFELWRRVTTAGTSGYRLMDGYDDIVSDAQGHLTGIDASLPVGTYELREKAPLDGYGALSSHVHFSISATGVVDLVASLGNPEGVTCEAPVQSDGTVAYQINVPNKLDKRLVKFLKVDNADQTVILPGATFDLYEVDDQGHKKQDPSIDLTGIVSGEDGFLAKDSLVTFALSPGRYYLVETAAPDGYVVKDNPVVITVTTQPGADGVSYTEGTAVSDGNAGCVFDTATSTYTLTVTNSGGTELPSSGGVGPELLYVLGAVLVAAAGLYLVRQRVSEIG